MKVWHGMVWVAGIGLGIWWWLAGAAASSSEGLGPHGRLGEAAGSGRQVATAAAAPGAAGDGALGTATTGAGSAASTVAAEPTVIDDTPVVLHVFDAEGRPAPQAAALALDANGLILALPSANNPTNERFIRGADGVVQVPRLANLRHLAVSDPRHRTVIVSVPDGATTLNAFLDTPVQVARLDWPSSYAPGPLAKGSSDLPAGLDLVMLMDVVRWYPFLPTASLAVAGVSHGGTLLMGGGEGTAPVRALPDFDPAAKYVLDSAWLDGVVLTWWSRAERTWIAATPGADDLDLRERSGSVLDVAAFAGDLQDFAVRLDVALDVRAAAARHGARTLDLSRCDAALFLTGPDKAAHCLGPARHVQAFELALGEAAPLSVLLSDSGGQPLDASARVFVSHDERWLVPLKPTSAGQYALFAHCGAKHQLRVQRGHGEERFELPAGATQLAFRLKPMGSLAIDATPEQQAQMRVQIILEDAAAGRLTPGSLDLSGAALQLPIGRYRVTANPLAGFPGFDPLYAPRIVTVRTGELTRVRL